MHTRQAIREAVVNLLKGTSASRPTAAGERVFDSRFRNIFPAELPCLIVYAMDETVEDRRSSPRMIDRSLSLAVDIFAEATDQVEDDLDALAEQVESVMSADETLGGLTYDCILSETEMSVVADGETLIGSARLTFIIEYEETWGV